MKVIGDFDKNSFGVVSSREYRRRRIDSQYSHSDFVSRIVIRESRVIGLWLEGHEC